mgnify:FL=1
MRIAKLIPPAAALTSVGSCQFIGSALGLVVTGPLLAGVGLLVLILCAAGEVKKERKNQTPKKNQTELIQ